MGSSFRVEQIKTPKGANVTPKGFLKVFTNTNEYLPIDIDIKNRFGVFCAEGEQYLEHLKNFEVRKDDVWVISMPKSGTTWMLEMVWMLVNNFDYETAIKIDQRERCHYLEYVSIDPSSNSIEKISNIKSPRILKSHLPIHMLPKGLWTVKPKIVYVTRDPKDGIVSLFKFFSGLGICSANMEVFVNETIADRSFNSPFWAHVAEFWNLRNEPNIYFTSFERMKRNLRCEVLKVSNLLEKNISKEQLDKLIEHLSFDTMKNNPACNNIKEVASIQKLHGIEEKPMGVFIRKGKIGSYKEELNNDLVKALEDWTQRSTKTYGITAEEIFYS